MFFRSRLRFQMLFLRIKISKESYIYFSHRLLPDGLLYVILHLLSKPWGEKKKKKKTSNKNQKKEIQGLPASLTNNNFKYFLLFTL